MAAGLGDATIAAMIRHHHERLDGKGYPDGLTGEEIPLGARIIAVADTFDAITSDRAYRRASSHKRALDVLAREAGTQLDAAAVAGFVGYYRGLPTVAWSAFAAAAPQRLLAWLGGLTPSVGAGAAGAAALLIGVGDPQPPIVSSDVAATPNARVAAPRAAPPEADAPARARRASLPTAARDRPARRRAGTVAPPARTRARTPAPVAHHRTHTPAPTSAPSPQDAPAGQGSVPARPTRPAPKPPAPPRPLPLPEVSAPEIELPVVKLPAIELPAVELPAVELPAIEVSGVELPELQLPPLDVSGLRLP